MTSTGETSNTDEVKSSQEFTSSVEAADFFLQDEGEYVEKSLRVGYETFIRRLEVHERLKKTIIDSQKIQKIFGSYQTIYQANNTLYDDLMKTRLISKEQLRDKLGKFMVDFIPYLKIYSDYIVKRSVRTEELENLKKNNKKFREFLKINEFCAKSKIKKILQRPIDRLPEYLQKMADVYAALVSEGLKESEPATTLLQAILNVKKTTDEISIKCKDQKARRLVGKLQQEIFNNKILLLTPHRFAIKHEELKIIKNAKLVSHKFILCNDILVISTIPSTWSAGKLIAVFPLIGLRVIPFPQVSQTLVNDAKYRFAIIPQNKNYELNESNSLGSVIAVSKDEESLNDWIDMIEITVEEEEHNLRPCNPVDLEKRLRKEKTSPQGKNETVTITDQEKIKEIEEWKKLKEEGQLPTMEERRQKRIEEQKNKINNNDNNNSNNNSNITITSSPTRSTVSGSPTSPPKKPPPSPTTSTRNTLSHVPPPKRGAPPKRPPPNPRLSKSKPPPKRGPPKPNSKRGPPKNLKEIESKPQNRRSLLLSGIKSFDKTNKLKTVETKKQDDPSDMNGLLKGTLDEWRKYVQPDSDSDDNESEQDWDD